MDHDLTACLPHPPTFDPWFEYYFGAAFCDLCFDAALRQLDSLPARERGDACAIAARGLYSLNRAAEAAHRWAQARELGGPEVDALAIWIEPAGLAAAEARATDLADAGLRADAWCDVAALRLVRNHDRAGAASAIGQALAACPEHREAHHWARFLTVPDLFEGIGRAVRRRSRRAPGLAERDARELVPSPLNGFVSPRRAEARLVEPDPAATRGSAWALLVRAGIRDTFLATPEDWATVPTRHPLLQAELDLGRVVDLVDEGRPALGGARGAWQAARASGDPERQDDVAQVLCALATHDPELVPLAAECADWLCRERAHPGTLFWAYRAWARAAGGGDDGAAEARALLGRRDLDDLSWRLALEGLRVAGARAEVDAALAVAVRDPARRALAQAQRKATPEPLRVRVSPRLSARDMRAAARPHAVA